MMVFESLLSAISWPVKQIRNLLKRPDQIEDDDHALVKSCSEFRSYATSHATYPKIRTFYHPHAHAGKLQAIADLPLLVFVHGMGGSLPQFGPLLGSFVNIAPVFGIELPGHGISSFRPTNYEAYEFDALVELWQVAIDEVCELHGHRKIVLIGHSMGCSVSAALAATSYPLNLTKPIVGIVAICPKATPPTAAQVSKFRRLLGLPDFVLNILRWFDRLGGVSSNSVKRFVGESAGIDLKRLQLSFNKQFRTPVWKRISIGCLPNYAQEPPVGGLPGRSTWESVQVPLLLIGGDADTVTKPTEVADIIRFVQGKHATVVDISNDLPVASTNKKSKPPPTADDRGFGVLPKQVEITSMHSEVVKSVILPAPSTHALLYDHRFYRTVAGLMEDFFSRHVAQELELGWQLQQLTTSGKWDVKNLEKWKKVRPVSGPIAGGLFRAMKTLREQDEEHTPSVFLEKWRGKIFAVIDISHDSPVYDSKALEKGGVQYHKFPTVSKIPPTLVEVEDFIALVDRLREEIHRKSPSPAVAPAIGVHCHYGYNRTGFFIVCYLVERNGWKLDDAIAEFAKHKPPGIKHDHFIDTLYVRYCVGLRRTSVFS